MCLSVPGWLFHALNFQMGSFTDWPDECLEMLAHLKIRPSLEQLNWMIFSVLKFHLQRRWYLTKLARGTLDISNQLVIWKFAKSSKQLFKYCCVDYWKSLIQRFFSNEPSWWCKRRSLICIKCGNIVTSASQTTPVFVTPASEWTGLQLLWIGLQLLHGNCWQPSEASKWLL